MAYKNKKGNSASKTKGIYKEITRKFLESMDNEKSIYHQPWKAIMPVSNNTGKAYLGVNAITLMHKSIDGDFESDRWIMVAPRKDKKIETVIEEKFGIKPTAGEAKEMVMFFSIIEVPLKEEMLDESGEPTIDERTKKPILVNVMKEDQDKDGNTSMVPETRTRFIPREYFGYNLSQFDDVPEDMMHPVQKTNVAFNDVIASMLEETGFTVQEGFKSAGIDPDSKIIKMPNKASFEHKDMYNVLLFQQLIAATGVKDNLNRFPEKDTLETYTDTVYDRESSKFAEEQFAGSLGAVMMTALINDMSNGNQHVFESQALKMKEWRFMMEDDPGFLVRSSRIAQRSIDFLIRNIPDLNVIYKPEGKRDKNVKQPASPRPT